VIAGPSAPLAPQLQRVWAERGDFSKVTQASLDAPTPVDEVNLRAEGDELSPEELWKLKEGMLGNLECARSSRPKCAV
jgi:hypothetical protein